MDRQTTEYRGWELTVSRGRPWVGAARFTRAPFDVFIVKGFSDWEVLADLRRRVDEAEDAGNKPDGTK
jgi:hypothetical protein